jgi:hypothetical protein
MYTNDNDFPLNKRTCAFVPLWQMMLDENMRELKYTARMASISFSQTSTVNSIGFSFGSFNQNYF